MKRFDLTQYAPFGFPVQRTFRMIWLFFVGSVLYALSFFITYSVHYARLFRNLGKDRILVQNRMMPDFYMLIEGRFNGFMILMLSMIGLAIYHYAYHHQGSKSIYLMKRLPDSWALWFRCFIMPAMVIFTSAIISLALILTFYVFYMNQTPESCIMPNQWAKLMAWLNPMTRSVLMNQGVGLLFPDQFLRVSAYIKGVFL